ncbi:methyltransferase domain-containing protein [Streptosporangium sp. CA-115845]|uniref:methyltransferase domain-containing protein n=1 Tax=Streptosporangium sp. CA-115845 TaxID=3240071 RepID=UPI003D8D93E8
MLAGEELGSSATAGVAQGLCPFPYADANDLPFGDESFDAVTHGCLLRNVENVERVLEEQCRVLKRGGRAVILETCPPRGLLASRPERLSRPRRLGVRYWASVRRFPGGSAV